MMRSRWEQEGVPNPGSERAERLGCICPYWENFGGSGVVVERDLVFYIAVGCPLHAPVVDTAPL